MGIFVDKRLDARYQQISEAMRATPSVVVRQFARNRSEEVAFGRFLNNRFVSAPQLLQTEIARTAQASAGRDVLLIEDTSTMGFGLYSSITGLGEIGDGRGRGFYLHPVISIDAQSGQCLGLAAAKLYTRHKHGKTTPQRKRERNRERLDQKESYRWYEEVASFVQSDHRASSYTVVADREADIYELLVLLTGLGVDYVIRNFQNRRLTDDQKLDDLLAAQPVQGEYRLAVAATDRRSAHTAQLSVKWTRATLARPRSGTGTKHLVDQLELTVIDVCEQPDSIVGKEKPIHWRLYTSHPVATLADAQRIIGYYTRRWVIEQLFRSLKKQGLDLASAQVSNHHALENLTALSLLTAVQIMQLVQARDEPETLEAQAVFPVEEAELIQRLNPGLEGKTEKQKNPHPPDSLAFATWVIARLGGWSGYSSQRPPGPITIWHGLKRFRNIAYGQSILDQISKIE